MEKYKMETTKEKISFVGEEKTVHFFCKQDSPFFFISGSCLKIKEKKYDTVSYDSLDLKMQEDVKEMFSKMMIYAKEKGCKVFFCSDTFNKETIESIKNVGFSNISEEDKENLEHFVSFFKYNANPGYFFCLEEKFLQKTVRIFNLFHCFFLPNLQDKIPFFDYDQKTKKIYCDGFQTDLTFMMLGEKLFALEKTTGMMLDITEDREKIEKEMMPYIERFINKGRIKNLVEPDFYFLNKYFKENYSDIYYAEMIPYIEKAIPETNREIEKTFYKAVNYKNRNFTQKEVKTYAHLFSYKENFLVIDIINKKVEFFTCIKKANKAFELC